MSSWAEELKEYRRAKSTTSWEPSSVRAPKLVTRYEKSREERQFDPILQVFRDGKRERGARSREGRRRLEKLNHARDRQMRYSQTYDIVSHTSKIGMPSAADDKSAWSPRRRAAEGTKKASDTAVDYNIISNHKLAAPGRGVAVLPDERDVPEAALGEVSDSARAERRRAEKEAALATRELAVGHVTADASAECHGVRQYNIVTNTYFRRHEERVAEDVAASREEAAGLFWDSHAYHPILSTFYDADEEKRVRAAEAEERATRWQARKSKFPPAVLHSEGALYDLVSMRVKDEAGLRERDAVKNRGVTSKVRSAMEAKQRERGEAARQLAEARGVKRIAPARFADTLTRDYDPFNLRAFRGMHGQPPPKPVVSSVPSVWERCVEERAKLMDMGLLKRKLASPAPASPVRADSAEPSSRASMRSAASAEVEAIMMMPSAERAASAEPSSRPHSHADSAVRSRGASSRRASSRRASSRRASSRGSRRLSPPMASSAVGTPPPRVPRLPLADTAASSALPPVAPARCSSSGASRRSATPLSRMSASPISRRSSRARTPLSPAMSAASPAASPSAVALRRSVTPMGAGRAGSAASVASARSSGLLSSGRRSLAPI